MCRLFALHAGSHDVEADFWLLEAPTSLAGAERGQRRRLRHRRAERRGRAAADPQPGQGRRATGIYRGVAAAGGGVPVPRAPALRRHRAASRWRTRIPFLQDGRVFAHNGVVGDLERLERRLGEHLAMVSGETDSERVFALDHAVHPRGRRRRAAPASPRRSASSPRATSSTASTSSSARSDTCGPSAIPSTTRCWSSSTPAATTARLVERDAHGTLQHAGRAARRRADGGHRQRADGRRSGLAGGRRRRARPRRARARASTARRCLTEPPRHPDGALRAAPSGRRPTSAATSPRPSRAEAGVSSPNSLDFYDSRAARSPRAPSRRVRDQRG